MPRRILLNSKTNATYFQSLGNKCPCRQMMCLNQRFGRPRLDDSTQVRLNDTTEHQRYSLHNFLVRIKEEESYGKKKEKKNLAAKGIEINKWKKIQLSTGCPRKIVPCLPEDCDKMAKILTNLFHDIALQMFN